MSMIRFSSLESLTEYVRYMLNEPMYPDSTSQYTSWLNAYRAYMETDGVIKRVIDGGREYWETPELNSSWVAEGEKISVSSGTSTSTTSQAQAVGGGGVKSAPKVQTIVTDRETGGAVEGEIAKGVKNFGLSTQNEIANIVGGISKTLGIANLAINAQNLGLYRNFCNYVFGTGFTEDVTLSDIKDFLLTTTQTLVVRDAQDRIVQAVPESIARKMYDFFKEHITQTGGTGLQVYLPDVAFSLVVFGEPSAPYNTRYLTCITNVEPNNGTFYASYVKPSDTLLQRTTNDFCNWLTGAGFNMTNVVTESLVASMEGVFAKIFENSTVRSYFGDLDGVNLVRVNYYLTRSTGVPKSQPISLSEISIKLFMYGVDLHIDTTLGEDNPRVRLWFRVNATPGSKYLKRGYTGDSTTDYGYYPSFTNYSAPQDGYYKYCTADITYPANVQTISRITPDRTDRDDWFREWIGTNCPINGYINNDYSESVDDSGNSSPLSFSNLGYQGESTSYEFDETLSAGFVKRSGNYPDVLPHDNTTIQGVYPEWYGNVKTLSQTDMTGDETQTPYIPVNMPHGRNNAEQIINNGSNNVSFGNQSQNNNQIGGYEPNTNIDDINDEIRKTIDGFNDSRVTPETTPDEIPETYPNPQYPETPPTEPDGDSGDTPDAPSIGGVTASGMVSVYNPTKQQLIDFSAWLWSPSFLDNFLKIFANPMDAIIGLHIMYATPISSGSEHIIAGYLDSNVSSKVVTQQYSKLDCGTIDIPEYYGNATDYEPYTTVHIYLPFIGIMPLRANDVIGKRLHLEYGVDALTGTCLATITTIKDGSEISCYTFAGNCAVQIPVSGGNYAEMIKAISGFIVAGAGAIATGNPIMALGAGASFMSGNTSVQHSGAIGSNAGACGIRKPYMIITRKRAYDAENYQHYYGFPSNKHIRLGTCKGYTQVKSCHVESIYRATDNEKQEIESLLKEGVIII